MNARVDTSELVERGMIARAFAVMVDLIRLTKPRITVMVVVTGLGGMWLAARTDEVQTLEWRSALVAVLAIALVVSGANVLNMYIERDSDALMARTANRPLPAGRLPAAAALWFGILLSAVSLPTLWVLVNPLTAALAALALVLYVFAYTPLKRVTSRALLVGAIPGAMPPLLGWTAATGSVDWPGIALFGVLFFWQLPHFVAIATFRSEEYARAGIIVLPAERGDRTARVHAVIYLLLLIAVSLVLVPLGVCGTVYCVTAVILGAGFLFVGVRGLAKLNASREEVDRWARQLFVVSLVYLPLLIGAIMVGA